jgi:hypothetical protein
VQIFDLRFAAFPPIIPVFTGGKIFNILQNFLTQQALWVILSGLAIVSDRQKIV